MEQAPVRETLYVSVEQLRGTGPVVLYALASIDNAKGVTVTLLRTGLQPFPSSVSSIKSCEGRCFVGAASAPGNQSTYTYLLLREAAVFERATGEITPSENPGGQLFGMMVQDRYDVDPSPGLYYVSARNDAGKTALLLGPYPRHLDALLMVGRASSYLIDRSPEATWLYYGTLRLGDVGSEMPEGKLNEHVLSAQEQAKLLTCNEGLSPDDGEDLEDGAASRYGP